VVGINEVGLVIVIVVVPFLREERFENVLSPILVAGSVRKVRPPTLIVVDMALLKSWPSDCKI